MVWSLELLTLLPPLALGGLLVGLAVDGLRLSRNTGVLALWRAPPPRRMLLALLAVKPGLVILFVAVQGQPDGGRGPELSARGLLLAAPLVLLVLALLAGEERLGLTERHFDQTATVAAGLVSAWLRCC